MQSSEAGSLTLASGGRCAIGTAVPIAHLPPEANYLHNICTIDDRFGSEARCAVVVVIHYH